MNYKIFQAEMTGTEYPFTNVRIHVLIIMCALFMIWDTISLVNKAMCLSLSVVYVSKYAILDCVHVIIVGPARDIN